MNTNFIVMGQPLLGFSYPKSTNYSIHNCFMRILFRYLGKKNIFKKWLFPNLYSPYRILTFIFCENYILHVTEVTLFHLYRLQGVTVQFQIKDLTPTIPVPFQVLFRL
jgi:hypothetical protein